MPQQSIPALKLIVEVQDLVRRLTSSGDYRTITTRYADEGITVTVCKSRDCSEDCTTTFFFLWGDK